jgi:RNA polymerase sigma-70 factor (ECF subfamily)
MKRQCQKKNLTKTRRYEKLVIAHSDWLYRYAYWISGNRQEAEDLVQETYLRAWRFLDSLQEDAAAKSWLTTILRRENARKYERKRLAYGDVDVNAIADHHTELDTRPETIALRVALKELPPKYREPLILQVLGGFSLKDLAGIFNLPGNTIATRLHRAKRKLRQQLKETVIPTNSLCGYGAQSNLL